MDGVGLFKNTRTEWGWYIYIYMDGETMSLGELLRRTPASLLPIFQRLYIFHIRYCNTLLHLRFTLDILQSYSVYQALRISFSFLSPSYIQPYSDHQLNLHHVQEGHLRLMPKNHMVGVR